MHVGCACHGNCIFIILEAVGGLVLNRGANLLLVHARLESASLNHEIVDHPMKYRIIIKTAVHIVYKILNGQRSLFAVQFESDIAVIGVEFDHVCPYFPGKAVPAAGTSVTSLISSMITVFSGTSLGNGPPEPVGVPAILLATSIPLITLPNTV